MVKHKNEHGGIVLYKGKVEVKLDKDTVWLGQDQIAELFGTKRPAITKHLSNIFKSKELNKKAVCSILEHTAGDGKTYKKQFYNLDAIISVGYRVNSGMATKFRIWATNVLRKHLVDGYTVNEKRLKMHADKVKELSDTVSLLRNVAQLENISDESKGIIQIISEYAKALDLLDDYDHQSLKIPKGTKRSKYKLTYEKACEIIAEMKRKFKDSNIVGQEKDSSFKGSIGAICQTFGSKDLYPTVEEKSAHLLYFVVKNHSFVDGNKRIAAALFVCFLQKNGILINEKGEKRINDSTLVALTLMIASSKPKEKDLMIKVILNLIN